MLYTGSVLKHSSEALVANKTWIKSSVFEKFLSLVHQVWTYRSSRRLISVVGPSDFGKTISLRLLGNTLEISEFGLLYVDLAQWKDLILLNEALKKIGKQSQTILLLDNAQLYEGLLQLQKYSLIIAAFSPQMVVKHGSDSNPEKWLTKELGTRSVPFYVTPFHLSDMYKVLTKYGYTVSDEDPPNHCISVDLIDNERIKKEKVISSIEILRLLFITSGTPGYIADFLMFGNFVAMDRIITGQLSSAMLFINREQQMFASKADLAKAVHTLFYGRSNLLQLVNMGIAYKVGSTCYLAHLRYLELVYKLGYVAVQHSGSSFDRLEAVAEYILLTNQDCRNSSGLLPLALPVVTERIIQTSTDDDIRRSVGVVLIQLMRNHPAIDLILFNCSNNFVYFIQCSYSKYHNHDTKYKHLKELTMPNTSTTVYDFYRDKLGFEEHFYIYATFQPTKPKDKNVHIMSLNWFPEYFAET